MELAARPRQAITVQEQHEIQVQIRKLEDKMRRAPFRSGIPSPRRIRTPASCKVYLDLHYKEQEADTFAADLLILGRHGAAFVKERMRYSKDDIRAFASSRRLRPGSSWAAYSMRNTCPTPTATT